MRKPYIEFSAFEAACSGEQLTAKCHHATHWQIIAPNGRRVDFWPTAKGGPKFYVIGGNGHAQHGSHIAAIEAALGATSRFTQEKTKQGEVTKLRHVAEAALDYLRFDGKLLDQMDHEQAEACLSLLIALREAGYRMRPE